MLILSMVEISTLVEEFGGFGKNQETMGEATWNQDLLSVLGGEDC
jgi:hypothetical protein